MYTSARPGEQSSKCMYVDTYLYSRSHVRFEQSGPERGSILPCWETRDVNICLLIHTSPPNTGTCLDAFHPFLAPRASFLSAFCV